MSRKRIILFVCIILALLVIPMALPYLIGRIVLPTWAYLLYAFVILVNAGVYLVDRLWLIDRFFVKGKVWAFVGWNVVLVLFAVVLQLMALDITGTFKIGDGRTVSQALGMGTIVSQRVFCSVFGLIMVLVSLAIAMSDEWRQAAFKYREAAVENERLGRDIDSLKGQVDALSRRSSAPAPDSISVKVDLMMTKVMLDDIVCVKADGDYVVIHKTDGSTLMTLMTLKSLEKQVPSDRFCRVHRSWIVNIDKVRGLRGGKILVALPASSPVQIPLSDSCKASFFELLSHRSILLRTE